jgi:3-deoxy-7-phosphoheptulonate synthase
LPNNLKSYHVDTVQVRMRPALLPYGEILQLHQSMYAVQAGEAFLLQAGDCAERFEDCSKERLKKKHDLLMQMAALIELLAGLPVVVLGRYGTGASCH